MHNTLRTPLAIQQKFRVVQGHLSLIEPMSDDFRQFLWPHTAIPSASIALASNE